MKDRLYRYVGPEEIRKQVIGHADRSCINSWADLKAWVEKAEPNPRRRDYVPVTFIVDEANRLWIADRRSEHVACAAGGSVLAAGELVVSSDGKSIEVVEATNQSTGYCPEPDCWEAVANALDVAGILHPGGFTTAFQFRRCTGCGSTNLVKDGVYQCSVCRTELCRGWNFG
jgi:hypothetical protein